MTGFSTIILGAEFDLLSGPHKRYGPYVGQSVQDSSEMNRTTRQFVSYSTFGDRFMTRTPLITQLREIPGSRDGQQRLDGQRADTKRRAKYPVELCQWYLDGRPSSNSSNKWTQGLMVGLKTAMLRFYIL